MPEKKKISKTLVQTIKKIKKTIIYKNKISKFPKFINDDQIKYKYKFKYNKRKTKAIIINNKKYLQ